MEGHEEHAIWPHSHAWHPPEHSARDRCSGRFWCITCREWADGDLCDLPGTSPGGKPSARPRPQKK